MTRRRKAALAGGAVGAALFCVTVPVVPATSTAAESDIGGFDTFGFGTPVSMLVYEPFIPVPDAPQGEMRFSYSDARLQSGPLGLATASSIYPGPSLANGLPVFGQTIAKDFPSPFKEIIGGAFPPYPVQTTASYPGTESDQQSSKTLPPGRMAAEASASRVTATADTVLSAAAAPVSFGQVSSTATMTATNKKAEATAVTAVEDLALLASLVEIRSVRTEVNAASDGVRGTADGKTSISGLTVAGQRFTVDEDGVHGPDQLGVPGIPLPGMPANGAALLKRLGLSFTVPEVTRTVSGSKAEIGAHSLVVSVETDQLQQALGRLPIRQLIALTPNPCVDQLSPLPTGPCLHDQFDSLLNLSPRIDYLIANAFTRSNAVPVFIPTLPPIDPGDEPTTTTTPGEPGTPGTPGTSGTPGLPATGGTTGETPTVAAPLQPLANQLPLPFGGLGALALVLGLGVAGLAGYALRWAGLPIVVGGTGGCDRGAPGGVPDLRRG